MGGRICSLGQVTKSGTDRGKPAVYSRGGGEGGHDGLYGGELSGNGVKLFGYGRKRVERGAHERDEDRLAVGQVVELPVVRDGDLFWGEA